jgi:hypothetical protein
MKKRILPGIVTLLVTGMIFMSGCTGPVSANTTPVTPSAPHIVDYTVPVTPNPVPTTPIPTTAKPTPIPTTQNPASANATQIPTTHNPASANTTPVPTNQSLTSAHTTLMPSAAVPAVTGNGYNRSEDIYDAPPSALPVEGVTGTLIIYVGGGSADGFTVYIARDGTNVPPFDPAYDPYRNGIGDQNPGYLHVRILPDGSSGIVNLMPGTYLAYLPDRSGGQPEQQSFTMYAKDMTYVKFTGHAAGSSGGGCGC